MMMMKTTVMMTEGFGRLDSITTGRCSYVMAYCMRGVLGKRIVQGHSVGVLRETHTKGPPNRGYASKLERDSLDALPSEPKAV